MQEKRRRFAAAAGKHVRNRVLSGILVLVPLAITLIVLRLVFNILTSFALSLLRPLLAGLPDIVLTLVALSATLLTLYMVGSITTHLVGRRLVEMGETLLLRLPIVKTVYGASKQVVDTFSTSARAAYKAVVMVEFPRTGSLGIGFVTGSLRDPEGTLLFTVFVPTAPNPTSGFLIVLPRESIRYTDISVEDGIKMIVSGGLVSPASFAERPEPLIARS
jgi:uncharacterized membrane protein